MAVRIEALSDDNYVTWAGMVRLVLEKDKLWDSVSGARPSTITPEYAAKLYSAKAVIGLYAGPEHILTTSALDDPSDLWKTFKERYEVSCAARKLTLRRELTSLRKSSEESVASFLERALMLRQKLMLAGGAMDDGELQQLVTAGLPDSFEAATLILSMQKSVQMAEFRQQLVAAESLTQSTKHWRGDATGFAARARPGVKDLRCYWCNQKGHLQRNCAKYKADQRRARAETKNNDAFAAGAIAY